MIFIFLLLREIRSEDCSEIFTCPDGSKISIRGNRTVFDGPTVSPVGSKSLVPKPLCRVQNLVEELKK